MVIGVTGSFGSGKTTVARIFKSLGGRVIDADGIARSLIDSHRPIYKKIISTFGGGILAKNKKIDRVKLADIVFSNKKNLDKLNKITHPQVIRIIKNEIQKNFSRTIIIDAPLLIEARLMYLVNCLVVVKLDRRQQINRLLKKTSLSKSQILKRIKAQLPLRQKARLADFVIDNSESRVATIRQARKIWAGLRL